jgi:DNA-binding NtrC family response regulator
MVRILVLDDIPDAVRLIRRILQQEGREIVGFTEEAEALDYARANAVDLAILDIKLKRTSGLKVLEQLKGISPSMRAIMLTGYPTPETARTSRKLGANGYCVKPIDNDELEQKVASVLADGRKQGRG